MKVCRSLVGFFVGLILSPVAHTAPSAIQDWIMNQRPCMYYALAITKTINHPDYLAVKRICIERKLARNQKTRSNIEMASADSNQPVDQQYRPLETSDGLQ